MGLRAGTRATGSVSAQALGPSAAVSTASLSSAVIPDDNTTTTTLTVVVGDVDGGPLASETPVVTSTGTGNTISAPGASDGSGVSTCTFKSSAAESKTLTVKVGGRTCATLTLAVNAAGGGSVPTVSSITPAGGDLAGSLTVVIAGSNFTGTTGVTIGGGAATSVSADSDGQITCVTPAHADTGAHDVVVTNATGPSTTGTGLYTYYATPDIYVWDFEGATDAAAQGAFVAGNGTNYIKADNWIRDTAVYAVGAQSVRQDYPQSELNVGNAFYYGQNQGLPANLKHVFLAFRYRQDASADLGDPWKGVRFSVDITGGHAGTLNAANRSFFWDNLNGASTYYTNTGVMPTMSDARGVWHHYEIEWDISDEVTWTMVMRMWIDGVLYFGDRTWDTRAVAAQSAKTLGAAGQYGIQFDGTVNRLDNASSAWFDDVKISTTRIGYY
jgi:hypothetical protein